MADLLIVVASWFTGRFPPPDRLLSMTMLMGPPPIVGSIYRSCACADEEPPPSTDVGVATARTEDFVRETCCTNCQIFKQRWLKVRQCVFECMHAIRVPPGALSQDWTLLAPGIAHMTQQLFQHTHRVSPAAASCWSVLNEKTKVCTI